MRKLKLILFLLALSLSLNSWCDTETKIESPNAGLFSIGKEAAARMVLVLYVGRDKNLATMSGARMNMYRPRGYSPDITWNQITAKTIAKNHGLTYLADWWMTEVKLNCAVMQIPEDREIDSVIDELQGDNLVIAAQKMSTFNTMSSRYNDPYYEIQESSAFFDLAKLHRETTGKNIRIAVIDTGVEYKHPDLEGQIFDRENFVLGISPEFSNDIHGTAVAGVIAAKADNSTGIVGMAPDSKVVALKACWPVNPGAVEAVCNSFTLALAINKALAMNVDILNLSLSGPPDKVITLLINEAIKRGVNVVVATSVGEDGKMSFPASIPGVIAVAGHSEYESPKDVYCIVIPNQKILTTVPHGKYNFLSGTSFGAAQVSGYIALLKEQNPKLSDEEIKLKLAELKTTIN